MTVRIGIPKGSTPGENRVALVPGITGKYKKLGVELLLEHGAGAAASFPDELYEDVTFCRNLAELSEQAQVMLSVQPPNLDEVELLHSEQVILGYMYPHRRPEVALALRDRNLTSFAMELLPRITRAQSMDALTSQAAVAGYKAVLMAANMIGRFLPMLTTPAGTIRPAKVLVIGAGVAGLQAIATAKRLGAIVEAYDVRRATREQVQSLGGRFVALEVDAEAEGGYARQLTPEEEEQERALLADHIAQAEVVISTAAIPGRDAPKLIFQDAVERMRPGSVIVDLAAATGGNCVLTVAGEDVIHKGVHIYGPENVPSQLPVDASELYARNLLNFVQLIVKDGELVLDWEDPIISGSVLTHNRELHYELSIPSTMEAALAQTLKQGVVK
ncbi:MAG: Re/Si-specific NAD(P)(+) transhydrogenase subunit alpha [Gaiellales bacterium]|nr:Re/Si-specific NAD(P)(+) transhydrogenase subunit alpha [Gaiellales bacterium]